MVQQRRRLRDCRDVREECTKDAYKQCTDQFDACSRTAVPRPVLNSIEKMKEMDKAIQR
jgi:hypothetical protein